MAEAPRAPRVPRFTSRNVLQAAVVAGALWGGGMMLIFAGPFAQVTATQGGVTVDARERTLAQLARVVVPYALGGVIFGALLGGVLLLANRKARKDAAAMLAGAGLEPGERLLEDGPANRQERVAVGGWLYLTDRRLLFRPHRMNLGLGSPLDLPLAEVARVEPCSVAWVLPTGVQVTRADGTHERFVVWHAAREPWLTALREAAKLEG